MPHADNEEFLEIVESGERVKVPISEAIEIYRLVGEFLRSVADEITEPGVGHEKIRDAFRTSASDIVDQAILRTQRAEIEGILGVELPKSYLRMADHQRSRQLPD